MKQGYYTVYRESLVEGRIVVYKANCESVALEVARDAMVSPGGVRQAVTWATNPDGVEIARYDDMADAPGFARVRRVAVGA